MKVILADDHRVVREGLRLLLEDQADIEIAGEAANGRELLDLLADVTADVVLLDVRMPEVSGLEALPQIHDLAPDTKVIILSMHDEPAYVKRAVELGASGYLIKSAGQEEVVRALTAVAAGGSYIQGEVVAPLVDHIRGQDESLPDLSPREKEVLGLVASGMENKQIARTLGISEATVKTYLKSVFERLGVRSRAEAVAVGLREGLIE